MARASTGLARTLRDRFKQMAGRAKGTLTAPVSVLILGFAIAGSGGPAAAEAISARSVYVIDGDTIDVAGQRYRLVGFDTPEIYHARCDYELALGETATARRRELVGSGQRLELAVLPGRDRYDRGLTQLFVGRRDVGDVLIAEGLPEHGGGRRDSWC